MQLLSRWLDLAGRISKRFDREEPEVGLPRDPLSR
jgi:hypothetical protein